MTVVAQYNVRLVATAALISGATLCKRSPMVHHVHHLRRCTTFHTCPVKESPTKRMVYGCFFWLRPVKRLQSVSGDSS